jgi:hypothetical protein
MVFPPSESSEIAAFLYEIAHSSDRPKAQITSALAAIHLMYDALDLPDVSECSDIMLLKAALVKSSTVGARVPSRVMPMSAFTQLFLSWPSNKDLSESDLRLKCITLLALSVMLRPSDIAPKSKKFVPETLSFTDNFFDRNQVKFIPDGGVELTFFGIKNDTDRSGFTVNLPAHEQEKLDPGKTLKDYMDRTEQHCPTSGRPLFLTLTNPRKHVESSTVGRILESAIDKAGLSGKGFTAKSFRPTGATVAIEQGHDPDIVMKIGKWKTKSVFFNHYVHSRVANSFTSSIFQ